MNVKNGVAGLSPLVIARGGFSGLFPDSSLYAYSMAMMTNVPDLVMWCNVQLTKDGFRICVPSIMLINGTDVALSFTQTRQIATLLTVLKKMDTSLLILLSNNLAPSLVCRDMYLSSLILFA
ncbi:hypothetical protein RND81_03G044600 [Saponaria officinalis]|uniref:glycerophosphodiester phosphodiesterase n=1 Tax=Saponaria officinalis TaxID=3572 RepID=A0AAW1LYA5_SAPOF